MRPAIIVIGPSGLATAQRIKDMLGQAEIHGLVDRVGAADVVFSKTLDHVRRLFLAGRPVIGVCASGILVRALGSCLCDKHGEPPVLAVAEDGSSIVPLLGGHHGANELARQLAAALGGHAAITTAGELSYGAALDCPPEGWELARPEAAKAVMAELAAGAAADVDPDLAWLNDTRLKRDPSSRVRLRSSIAPLPPNPFELAYHPKRVVIGVGSDRGCPAEDLIALVDEALRKADVAREAVACVVSIDRKADEKAMHLLAEQLGVPVRFLDADAINAMADRIPNPSDVVLREVGVPGVAEGAALAATGASSLVLEKQKSGRATCAIAVADRIVEPAAVGRARGSVAVVGVGPGAPAWRSGEAVSLLDTATDWVGYGLYLDLVADLSIGQTEHRFDLGDEEARVRHALQLAGEGRRVALVCSGDAGIYAMAALVCEVMALDPATSGLGDGAHRAEIVVAPGISAFQAAAARLGAPIGHDFCCISLSDLLTPWPVIERRVRAAADGDFVVSFYNPRSMRRRDQLDRAIDMLKGARPGETPVIVASNLGRPSETFTVTTLGAFRSDDVDMLSIVLVGSSTTRSFTAGDGRQLVFTPRGYAAKREAAE